MSYGEYGKMDPEYLALLEKQGKNNLLMDAGGMGLNVLGTVVQGFGAYKQYQQAERQRKEERRRYEEQMRRQQEQDRIAAIERKKRDEEMRLSQNMGYGGYARTMQDQRTAPYQGFASRIGL